MAYKHCRKPCTLCCICGCITTCWKGHKRMRLIRDMTPKSDCEEDTEITGVEVTYVDSGKTSCYLDTQLSVIQYMYNILFWVDSLSPQYIYMYIGWGLVRFLIPSHLVQRESQWILIYCNKTLTLTLELLIIVLKCTKRVVSFKVI